MPDGVDPTKDRVKAPRLDAAMDRRPVEPEPDELRPAHDFVLRCCQRRHLPIRCVASVTHSDTNAAHRLAHLVHGPIFPGKHGQNSIPMRKKRPDRWEKRGAEISDLCLKTWGPRRPRMANVP